MVNPLDALRTPRYNVPTALRQGVIPLRWSHADLREMRLYRYASQLADLFFPPHCVVCGRLGAWLCRACIQSVSFLRLSACPVCGRPGVESEDHCPTCAGENPALSGMHSVSYYQPPLREAIHALKYGGVRAVAAPLGVLLAECWRRQPFAAHLIVPVPLHKARQRQRGYNQSLLLARELAGHIGLPLQEGMLLRTRNTRSQTTLTRQERQVNVRGAFHCPDRTLTGAHILLVDDVYTTGATLEACATALLEAGVGRVYALTLTRAGPGMSGERLQSARRDDAP